MLLSKSQVSLDLYYVMTWVILDKSFEYVFLRFISIFSDFYIQPNAPKATQRQPKTSKTAKAGWIIFAEQEDCGSAGAVQNLDS